MCDMKIVELMHGSHNVLLDDAPTFFEESFDKTIGAGSFVGRHWDIALSTSSSENGSSFHQKSRCQG
jgi:hypothetical protein